MINTKPSEQAICASINTPQRPERAHNWNCTRILGGTREMGMTFKYPELDPGYSSMYGMSANDSSEEMSRRGEYIKRLEARIAELEREHDEKDRNFDKMRELANFKGYQAALDEGG